MKMVSFSNQGVIDPRVWSTFGVSVKEKDDAIGQFGTGLKYAIAVLVRNGRSISITSGGNSYVFGCEKAEIRGKEFSQVTCNGEALPFTTHLGEKWELWQAYRELYSNCKDENGSIGETGETVIRAELGDIDHGSVFLSKNLKRVCGNRFCDIYEGASQCVYYKGIRAQDLTRSSYFTIDIKEADLTEDRTIKYQFELNKCVSSAVLSSTCPEFITRFLTQTKGFFEESIDFDYTTSEPSAAVIDVVKQYRRDNIYMQSGLVSKALSVLGADQFEPVDLDERQSQVVEKASQFCQKIGYPIRYPVQRVQELGAGTLALADRRAQKIYLSDRVLTQGVKQVASTLIEENLHLQEGLKDCTYDMQSFLFDQIVTMGEKLTGEVL